MRAISTTVSSATSGATLPLDTYRNPFNVSLGCVVSAGATLTYKVQHTFDDVWNSSVTPTWFDNASITGRTASSDGNYAYPITAVRLVVTAWTSGSVTMTVIQSGMPGE